MIHWRVDTQSDFITNMLYLVIDITVYTVKAKLTMTETYHRQHDAFSYKEKMNVKCNQPQDHQVTLCLFKGHIFNVS